MSTIDSADVVIVGGGIVGISTAYYLAKNGIKSMVIERDTVGSHASGFAYGSLGALGGPGIPGPGLAVAVKGVHLHHQLAQELPERTGINIEYRDRPSLSLAFTKQDSEAAKNSIHWIQSQPDYAVKWIDQSNLQEIEPRISDEAIGAIHVNGTADVEPYRLVLALTQASESIGVTIRHGHITGLVGTHSKVKGVTLDSNDTISCEYVVFAMGPWSGEASPWLGIDISVQPLKGQILRLRAPGAPYQYSISWGDNYATTKPDGMVWAGTTEEDVGFDENPTPEARDKIMASLLRVLPALKDSELVRQTACLRPLSADRLMLLGKVPGWEGAYMATGAGRQGIVLGPAMGQITANLITKGQTSIPIDAFDPGRFSK